VTRKKEKHGLRDPFRVTEDDHCDHAVRYAQKFGHLRTVCTYQREMYQKLKNDEKLQQLGTLMRIYVGIEPIGGRAGALRYLARSGIGSAQRMCLSRKRRGERTEFSS
jgi:hypothetical protein